MNHRARYVSPVPLFLFAWLATGAPLALLAQDKVLDAIKLPAPDEQAIRRATQNGVKHLLSLQQKDGSIHDRGHDTSMTSLAIMAMASIGILPADPTQESLAMRRAIDDCPVTAITVWAAGEGPSSRSGPSAT